MFTLCLCISNNLIDRKTFSLTRFITAFYKNLSFSTWLYNALPPFETDKKSEKNLLWCNIIVLHSFNLFANFILYHWLISCNFGPKAIYILIQILTTIDNAWVNSGCLQLFTKKYTDRWRQKFLYVIISLDWRESGVPTYFVPLIALLWCGLSVLRGDQR